MKVDFFSPIVPKIQARNEAEKICRLITSEFPVISSTKISEFPAAKTNRQYFDFAKEITKRINKLVREPSHRALWQNGRDELDFYKTFTSTIKEHRIGNCGDMSKLYYLIANMNGIPTRKAEMFTAQNGVMSGTIDHAIQILPINGQKINMFEPLSKMKDLLIIDPWLGFADFAPKYEQKILADFHRFFGLPDKTKIYLNPYSGSEPAITEKVIHFFRENFPQLMIDKDRPLISHKKINTADKGT